MKFVVPVSSHGHVCSYHYATDLTHDEKIGFNNGLNYIDSLLYCFWYLQMNLSWKHDLKEFCLTLGTYGPSSTINCHVIVQTQLQQQLNMTGSIEHLVQVTICYVHDIC